MKRCLDVWKETVLPISKRTRAQHRAIVAPLVDTKPWISITELDSFCKNDQIVDWFAEIDRRTDNTRANEHCFLDFLFRKGTQYEEEIINAIREKTGLPLERVSSKKTSRDYDNNEKDAKKDFALAVECMKRGDPVIYNAYLEDSRERIRGIPDLLVRNDVIHTLFKNVEALEKKSSYFGDYYYVPIEIKFSTLHFSKNSVNLLNGGRLSFYKTQLYGYCKLLESVQHYLPLTSMIIGKRSMKSGFVYNPLDHIGRIDYDQYDHTTIGVYDEGIEWLRRVKKYGITMKPFENNLFPNMKADHHIYQTEKRHMASLHGEITDIWQCGIKNREQAIRNGITSWKDPRLTARVMGVSRVYEETVDAILKVNRGEYNSDYFPLVLRKNTHNFKYTGNEMFVDFETMRDSFEIDSLGSEERIFLIGVHYKGHYHSFRIESASLEDEQVLIDKFTTFWEQVGRPKCWYWWAEKEFWRRAMERHNDNNPVNIQWADLHDVVKEEPFVVKGVTNFKLKSFVKSLTELGKMNVRPPPETCTHGVEALFIAYSYYYEGEENEAKMNDIIDYNRFDCESLYQLLTFLRTLK